MDDQYADEAKQRWGNTPEYKQSQERVKRLTKADHSRIREENEKLIKQIVAQMGDGPASTTVQNLIDKHYRALKVYYEPNIMRYRGLAKMYIEDKRFAAYYKAWHKDLPQFMHDAIMVYCEASERKSK